jgi:hypothetical protein
MLSESSATLVLVGYKACSTNSGESKVASAQAEEVMDYPVPEKSPLIGREVVFLGPRELFVKITGTEGDDNRPHDLAIQWIIARIADTVGLHRPWLRLVLMAGSPVLQDESLSKAWLHVTTKKPR